MRGSKLVNILNGFSETEYKNLIKFARNAYFNDGRDYIPLLKILKKFHPGFNNTVLTKKHLHEKLYRGRQYNDQVIRNTLSGLLKVCEQFIVINRIFKDSSGYGIILADELKNKGLYRHAESLINKSLALLEEPDIDKNYFRNRYELMQAKREIMQGTNNNRGAIDCLSSEAADFFMFFLLETSRHIEEMVVFNHNLNADFEHHVTFKLIENLRIENINKYFAAGSLKNSKIAELFGVHIKLLIDYKNELLFENFQKLLKTSFNELSRWGKYNMYLCLENACIRLQEINENKYRKILFEIYKEQLEDKLYNYSDSSPMAEDMFRNIVINALRLSQFLWVEKFIKEYIGTLSPNHRENMYNFSFSLLNFEKGKFDESLSFISLLKYDAFVFKFDVKVLSLMIYYELGYIEEAISMVDSFRHFILESKVISDYIKEIHINFIKFLNEIIKLSDSGDHAAVYGLKREVETSRVRNKEWLLKKINSLNLRNVK